MTEQREQSARHLEKHRPILTAFVAFAAGTVAARYLPLDLAALALFAAACLAALILAIRFPISATLHTALVVALVAAAGAANYTIQTASARERARIQLPALLERHTATLCYLDGTIDGEVAVAPAPDPLATDQPQDPADPQRFESVFRLEVTRVGSNGRSVATGGAVRASVHGSLEGVAHGDRVRVFGWASPLNPDRDRYAVSTGLVAKISVPTPDAVRLERRGRASAARTLYALKAQARERINSQLPANAAAVAKVLLLGDREELGDRLDRAFNKSGTTHILSVSGFHIGIVLAVVYYLCRMLLAPAWLRRIIAVAVVLAYGVTTGLGPATVRAILMTFLFELASSLSYYREPLNALATAALVIIVAAPQHLFEAGFQLTFVGVAGIMLFASPLARVFRSRRDPLDRFAEPEFQSKWRDRLRTVRRHITLALAASATGFLAVAPLQAHYFDIVTPISVFATAALTPVIALFTSFGFLFLAVSFVPVLSGALAWLLGGLAAAFTGIVEFAAWVPFGHVFFAPPSLAWCFLFYAALLVFAARRRFRLSLAWAFAAPVAVLAAFLASLALTPPGGLAVTFANVGHGACALVTQGRHAAVFDCGSGTIFEARDCAREVSRELWRRGVRRIDLLVLSHSDLDHVSGVPSLAERIPVALVLTNPTFADDFIRPGRRGSWLLGELDRLGVPHRTVSAGDHARLADLDVEFLWPPNDTGPWRLNAVNDRSLVARVRCGDRSALFTGDIEGPALSALLASHIDTHAEIMALPHHGRGAQTDAPLAFFIRAVHPSFAVISDKPPDDRRHEAALFHPFAGLDLHQTYLYGTLRFNAGPSGWQLESSR